MGFLALRQCPSAVHEGINPRFRKETRYWAELIKKAKVELN